METKDLIELMQVDANKFNELREKGGYPVIEIKKIEHIELTNCNLKNVVFTGCESGTFKDCESGTFKTCWYGTFTDCESGTFTGCESGTFKDCWSGTFTDCRSGTFTGCGSGTFKTCWYGTFKTCWYGTFKDCESGTFTGCESGAFTDCRYGTFTDCESGTFTGCESGTFKDCWYGQITYSNQIKLIQSYLHVSWCNDITKKKCPKNDQETYVLIQKLEKHPDNPQLIKMYKSVRNDDKDFYTGKIHYKKGKEIICPDWDENYNGECGKGIHVSPTFEMAKQYNDGKCKSFWVHMDDFKVYPQNLTKVRAKKVLVID